MRGLQDHFPLSYRQVDEVVHLIADAAMDISYFEEGKHSKDPNNLTWNWFDQLHNFILFTHLFIIYFSLIKENIIQYLITFI